MATKTISGAEFKLHFAGFAESLADDDQVYFGAGDLRLAQIKPRGAEDGPKLFQIAFIEAYTVTADPDAA